MANFNLTYNVPYARLKKLSRSACRKAFGSTWWWSWATIGAFIIIYASILVFHSPIRTFFAQQGIKHGPDFLSALLLVGFLISLLFIRRHNAKQVQERVDFDQNIELTTDDKGVRLELPQIGYHLKWSGISQVFLERDGIALGHGPMFFLVPSAAFASKDEEQAFLKYICENLTPDARSRSSEAVAKAGLI